MVRYASITYAAVAPLLVAPDDLAVLRRLARSTWLPAVLARRARILLLAADGVTNIQIAHRVGVSRRPCWPADAGMCAAAWRGWLTGLGRADLRRPPQPPSRDPPGHPEPATARAGDHALVDSAVGPRAGRGPRHDRPGLARARPPALADETFKFSADSELVAKVRDVVGLYPHLPERALVLCVDEKSGVPGRGAQPIRRVWPGRVEQHTNDDVRHGTTTLFAALEVATGQVTNQCHPRHRHQEFLGFLKQVARTYPRRVLHVICDNCATHKHPAVRGWLAKHPRSSCTSPRPRRRG